MSAEAKPVMSWDESVNDEMDGDDFLSDAQAQDVPKACSLDNPDCEACQ